MSIDIWLMFCAVALAATLSPGPAILLAMTNGVSGGARRVLWSSLGNISGLLCVAGLSVFGLGALLQTSALAFTVSKVVGALYLAWLGIKQWRRPAGDGLGTGMVRTVALSRWLCWREGVLVAVTNPKALIFVTALFPVFLDAHRPLGLQFMIMTGTLMAFSFACLMSYGLMANRVRQWFAKPGHQRVFQRTAGGVFVGMGLSLLLLGRSR